MRFVMSLVVLFAAAATAASSSAWEGVCSKEHTSCGDTAYNSRCAPRYGEALLGTKVPQRSLTRFFWEVE